MPITSNRTHDDITHYKADIEQRQIYREMMGYPVSRSQSVTYQCSTPKLLSYIYPISQGVRWKFMSDYSGYMIAKNDLKLYWKCNFDSLSSENLHFAKVASILSAFTFIYV